MWQRRWRRASGIGGMLIAAVYIGLIGGPVAAHAQLKTAEPPDKAVVATAPAQVLLVFSDETSARKSNGIVTDASGATISTGWKVDLNERSRMTIALKPDLPSGTYTVRFTTLDESDNESETGSVTFTVQATGVSTSVPVASAVASSRTASAGATSTVRLQSTATRSPVAATVTTSVTATPAGLSITDAPGDGSGPPRGLILVAIAGALLTGGLVAYLLKTRRSA